MRDYEPYTLLYEYNLMNYLDKRSCPLYQFIEYVVVPQHGPNSRYIS